MCWPVYDRWAQDQQGGQSAGDISDAADIARTAKLLRLLRSVRILRVIRALKWVKKLGEWFYLIASLIKIFRAVHHDDHSGNSSSETFHEADCRFIRHLRYHRMLPFWSNSANTIWKHGADPIHASSTSYAWRLVRNSSGTVNHFEIFCILRLLVDHKYRKAQ